MGIEPSISVINYELDEKFARAQINVSTITKVSSALLRIRESQSRLNSYIQVKQCKNICNARCTGKAMQDVQVKQCKNRVFTVWNEFRPGLSVLNCVT